MWPTWAPPSDFNYDHDHLGTSPKTLLEIAKGRHPFCSALLSSKNPAIILGAGLFEWNNKDSHLLCCRDHCQAQKVTRQDWNGLNVLLLNAAQAAALDLGLLSNPNEGIKSAKFLYLMGADNVSLEELPDDAFVVYQGHHGNKGVYRANVILPSAAVNEKERTYENTEGCTQWMAPAVPTVGDARDDWKIVRALSEVAGARLPYDSIAGVCAGIRVVAPSLLQVDGREPSAVGFELKSNFRGKMTLVEFGSAVENFYMTDSITRASKIMAQCSAALLKKCGASRIYFVMRL